MAYTVIRVLEDYVFSLAAATNPNNTVVPSTFQLSDASAVNVGAFQYVTPYVRIQTDPNNKVFDSNQNNAAGSVKFG